MRSLRRSTSFPNSSFNPSLESSLPIISFSEEIWFAVPSCRRFTGRFTEFDGVVCVDCEGDKVLSGCVDEEVSAEVEDVEETDSVEDNFSGVVEGEFAADAKEKAEHDREALASGSVRKQYSSS